MKKSLYEYVLIGAVSLLLVMLSLLVYKMDRPYHLDKILDGETILLSGGKKVRLLGIDLGKNGENASMSAEYLKVFLDGRSVWIESDRYGRDASGASYVWMWVGCESTPKLLLSGLVNRNEKPIGCKKGVLVNEQIIKMGWSKAVFPDKRGVNKYATWMTGQEK